MTQCPEMLDEILACETAVWIALQTGNAAADEQALSADFLGVYPSGFAGRADHVAQLVQGATIASFDLSETRLMQLSKDCVLLAYRADYLRVGQIAREAMYVSSIWRRNGTGWINVFSQDTEALSEGLPNRLP